MLNRLMPHIAPSTTVDSAGSLPAPIQSISRLDMQVALQHTHIVAEDASQTLCGLLAAYAGANDTEIEIPIGCDCGHVDCGHKPNCPVCRSIATGVVN